MSGWGEKTLHIPCGRFAVIFLLWFVLMFSSAFSQTSKVSSTNWQETLSSKKGIITVHWNTVRPFAYKDDRGQLVGIEVDLLKDFQEYLKSQYGLVIEIRWLEHNNFNQVYSTIQNNRGEGEFGIASFSILEDRKKEINFSPAYLKDISIIASNNIIPTVSSADEFINTFKELQAVAVPKSTSVQNLLKLKREHNLSFDIDDVNNPDEVVNYISEVNSDYFGYLELPNYIAALNDGLNVKRHNYAPVVRDGYAIIYPRHSGWQEPIEAYFSRVSFQYRKDQIISKYLGLDVLNLIQQIDSDDSINPTNEIGLLIREKEIQQRELNEAQLKGQKQESFRNMLILGLIFIAIVAGLLFYNNYQKSIINELLIQQQKQIEEQQEAIASQNNSLASSNKKLRKFNKQKNDLIGVLSHDLRTPINQIKGFAEIYKMENNKMSASQNELIDGIISTSDRLTNMIRKIMDVEAIDSNKLDIKMERINLSQSLKEISYSFEDVARNKNIAISYKNIEGDYYVEADNTYLTQVFENIISNAIKFSEPNKIVEVSLTYSGAKVRAIIKDQGPGLTKEDQKQLFKKYQKLSATPTGGEQSTGLGLSIVKKYVKKMNGKVWAESNDDSGSSFIVEFNKIA